MYTHTHTHTHTAIQKFWVGTFLMFLKDVSFAHQEKYSKNSNIVKISVI